MTSFSGRSTAIARRALASRSSRTQFSSSPISTALSLRVIPTNSTNLRIDAGVKPRRRNPDSVGMRGSSQPPTSPCSTSCASMRLLITV